MNHNSSSDYKMSQRRELETLALQIGVSRPDKQSSNQLIDELTKFVESAGSIDQILDDDRRIRSNPLLSIGIERNFDINRLLESEDFLDLNLTTIQDSLDILTNWIEHKSKSAKNLKRKSKYWLNLLNKNQAPYIAGKLEELSRELNKNDAMQPQCAIKAKQAKQSAQLAKQSAQRAKQSALQCAQRAKPQAKWRT